MNNFLELTNIKKSFIDGDNELQILKGINFSLKKEEIVAFVGPSGAGKSSLLHIIGGLSKPTEGEIKLNGNNIYNLTDKNLSKLRNNSIGFIFQFHHLLSEFSALENVAIPLLINGTPFKEAIEKARIFLVKLKLEHRLTHKPKELSGGEQQRVAIARAMITEPDIILADEPTGNLDKKNSEAVQELLINLAKEKKQTIIIVTHNEALANATQKIIKIFDGRIEEDV